MSRPLIPVCAIVDLDIGERTGVLLVTAWTNGDEVRLVSAVDKYDRQVLIHLSERECGVLDEWIREEYHHSTEWSRTPSGWRVNV